MEPELKKFKEDFESYLKGSAANGLKLEYHRPEEPSQFMLWIQKHLDELGILDADIEFNNDTLEIKNIKFDALGAPEFPYDIEMIPGANSPDNIKSVILKSRSNKS